MRKLYRAPPQNWSAPQLCPTCLRVAGAQSPRTTLVTIGVLLRTLWVSVHAIWGLSRCILDHVGVLWLSSLLHVAPLDSYRAPNAAPLGAIGDTFGTRGDVCGTSGQGQGPISSLCGSWRSLQASTADQKAGFAVTGSVFRPQRSAKLGCL